MHPLHAFKRTQKWLLAGQSPSSFCVESHGIPILWIKLCFKDNETSSQPCSKVINVAKDHDGMWSPSIILCNLFFCFSC